MYFQKLSLIVLGCFPLISFPSIADLLWWKTGPVQAVWAFCCQVSKKLVKEEASCSLMLCGNSSRTRQATRNLGRPLGTTDQWILAWRCCLSKHSHRVLFHKHLFVQLFVQWTLGSLQLPCLPRKPGICNFMSQNAKHKVQHEMDVRTEFFQTWGCSQGHIYILELHVCSGAPYGCVSSTCTVHFVLQSVSISFMLLHPAWTQTADKCCVFWSAVPTSVVPALSWMFSGNLCTFCTVL